MIMGIQEEYWEHIEGKTIVAIEAQPALPDDVDRALFETINFYVEGFCLRLGTNSDTDEITLSIEASALPGGSVETAKALKVLEGKEFFWLWLAENSQGYRDTVMMSFSDPQNTGEDSLGPVAPQFAFVGASGIQMLLLSEVG